MPPKRSTRKGDDEDEAPKKKNNNVDEDVKPKNKKGGAKSRRGDDDEEDTPRKGSAKSRKGDDEEDELRSSKNNNKKAPAKKKSAKKGKPAKDSEEEDDEEQVEDSEEEEDLPKISKLKITAKEKKAKSAKSAKTAKKEEKEENEEEKEEEEAPKKKVVNKLERRAAQKQKKAAQKKKVEVEDDDEDEEEEEEEAPRAKKGQKGQTKKAAVVAAKKKKMEEAGEIIDWPPYVRLKETGGKRKVVRDIKADDFIIQVPGQTLIKNATLTLVEGQSYGIIGRNGIGKSVLMKRIAYREEPFNNIPDYVRILFVEQEIRGDDTTPLDSVLHADEEREWLLNEEKRLVAKEKREEERQQLREQRAKEREEAIAQGKEPPPEIEEEEDEEPEKSYDLRDIYERLREIDSAKAEARASTILAGLGFSLWDIRNKTTKEFSGGWRMRIALARALFVCPDLLILDEPTNHLDLNAVIWLESYLENWKKTLLVVSHERVFLSAVAKNIIHFHNQTLTTYKGDYYLFLKLRSERQRQLAKQKDANERKAKKLKEFIAKDKNKGGGQANSRKLMLKNMKEVEEDTDDRLIKFEFPVPLSLGCSEDVSIIKFEEVSFGYSPDKIMFKRLDFGLDLRSRIALVGPNGVGKSTVLKLVAGQLKETGGFISRHRNLEIARFSQHHVDQLNMSMNPVEYLQSHFPGAQTQDVRKHLGGFGLPGQLALTSIDKLSGGQKSRVVLAELSWRKPHMLLLDEPTNHLDIEMIESLGEALEKFEGGLLLVSHNQRLIELTCNQLWVVTRKGTVERFNGSFDDYKNEVINEINHLLD